MRKLTISASLDPAGLSDKYVLAALKYLWEQDGHRVICDPAYHPDADVCLLHHNFTRLDPAKLPRPPAGVRVINGQIFDISKRLYSQLVLTHDDAWAGPVIVKTNLNHFGMPERRGAGYGFLQRLHWKLAAKNWQWARTLPFRTYPVLQSIRAVPDWVWRDPRLLVEKFMPEREGDLYALRGWMMMGSKGYGYRMFATDPMVKTTTQVRHEYHYECPPEIAALRREMKLEFGKIDYVVHDGVAIALDVNKTPTFAGNRDTPRMRMFARAIGEFMQ